MKDIRENKVYIAINEKQYEGVVGCPYKKGPFKPCIIFSNSEFYDPKEDKTYNGYYILPISEDKPVTFDMANIKSATFEHDGDTIFEIIITDED